jgi:hypothetical protein
MTDYQRECGLRWWRRLSPSQKIFEHKLSLKAHWTFEMFSASTSSIVNHWIKLGKPL